MGEYAVELYFQLRFSKNMPSRREFSWVEVVSRVWGGPDCLSGPIRSFLQNLVWYFLGIFGHVLFLQGPSSSPNPALGKGNSKLWGRDVH